MNYYKSSVHLVLIVVVCFMVFPCRGFDVRLYSQKQFEGRYTKLKVDATTICVNLPEQWDNNVISIDPLGCVVIFADRDCRGLRRRLDRWSWGCAHLKDISFDNKLSSVSPCPTNKKPAPLEL